MDIFQKSFVWLKPLHMTVLDKKSLLQVKIYLLNFFKKKIFTNFCTSTVY